MGINSLYNYHECMVLQKDHIIVSLSGVDNGLGSPRGWLVAGIIN